MLVSRLSGQGSPLMFSDGLRLCLVISCFLGICSGCKGVPAAPEHARNNTQNGEDEYEGWLFKTLTGQRSGPEAAQNVSSPAADAPTSSSPVVPAGYAGPLVPGPSSPSSSRIAPSLVDNSAGPPPSIPPELPSLPPGVSINDRVKAAEKEESGFDLSDLAPENVYKNLKKAAGYGPDEKIARATLQEGKELFRDKKYKEAASKFATAAGRSPDSPLEEDALFLEGESEFFSDQYAKAHDTFGGLLKKYPNTRHLDTVMTREFAIGRYWEQLYDNKPSLPITPNVTDKSRPLFDTFGYAIQAYQRIRLHDPTGPLADDSLMASANAYFRRGQYENAAYDYDVLIKEYPSSEHQVRAHMLGLQAKMRVYQGALYDRTPLKDAGKIAEKTLKQFGDTLGDERERVAQANAQILEEKANREFMRAKYYEGREYFGAARLYYQSVVDEYPSTQKAKEAKARLGEIRNKPDEPPNRFEWLTRLFE